MVSLRMAEVNIRPSLQRQITLPAKSLTTKSWVCPSGNRSSSILLVLLWTLSEKRSFSASSFGLVTSNVVTIGALFSSAWCLVAIDFSSWEKGAAARATDAAHSRGRMRRLSITSLNYSDRVGGRGQSHISERPNLSTDRRAVNSEVTN